MGGRKLRDHVLGILACTLCLPSFASPWQTRLRASYKSIFEYERLRQQGVFAENDLPQTEQRLRAEGSVGKDGFRVEVADELLFDYRKAVATSVPVPDFFTPSSAWETTTTWIHNPTNLLTQRIDRAYVEYSSDAWEIRAGKQVIDEGVGHLFNAVSQVPRYGFVYIDPEYPKTEDAASVVWKGPLTLEARYLPKVRGQREENFHLRAKGSKDGFDMALTAGRSDDKPYAGLEAAGNIGGALLRGELVGYEWQGQSAAQALIGIDRAFTGGINLQVETFYNGFGKPSGYLLEPFIHRSAPYRGRYYAGSVFSWEISARWKSTLAATVNLLDPSLLLQAFVNYSLMENLDLVLGQYLGIGGPASEFGGKLTLPIPGGPSLAVGLPDITYLELRYYF